MPTPLDIPCTRCTHFDAAEFDADSERMLYFCTAFPGDQGIPMDILAWDEPHLTVRDDQRGKSVYASRKPIL